MNSLHPYVLRIQTELAYLSAWKYFETFVAVTIFLIFFLIGRKSYESKFTHVLNTINDSENEKKRLSKILQSKRQSLRSISSKLTYFKMATLVIVLALAAYTYLKKFNPLLVIAVAAAIILFWLVTFLLKKYLDVTIKSTNEQLQKKLLSSQNDAKEIITLLGDDICKQLKSKFDRQLQVQWRTEELKDCDLHKCQQQKSIYKDLYQLYKGIIAQMQKMQWCDTCAQTLNTDANQIKLAEFDGRLKGYRTVSERLSLQKKKQLTNRLLQEWQLLDGKLSFMCKRGCCIRFRHSLEGIKKANHQKLKSLKNRLSLLK